MSVYKPKLNLSVNGAYLVFHVSVICKHELELSVALLVDLPWMLESKVTLNGISEGSI